MVDNKELLKEEINALKEILAHKNEEAVQNQWINKQLEMTVKPEFLSKYQDLEQEQLETHLDRLQRDLEDLESNEF
jgi:hypothetical protein